MAGIMTLPLEPRFAEPHHRVAAGQDGDPSLVVVGDLSEMELIKDEGGAPNS